MNISYEDQINQIRCYEIVCYSMCYYLLDCEHLALTAAQDTLFQLLNDEAFFLMDDIHKTEHTKKMSRKVATQLHFNQLTDDRIILNIE
jgi:hypothetical protein